MFAIIAINAPKNIAIRNFSLLKNKICSYPSNQLNRGYSLLNKIAKDNGFQKKHKSIFTKFKLKENDYKIKDNIPENFNLIYRNTMSNYLLGAQIVSVIGVVIAGMYVIYLESTNHHYEPHISSWKNQPVPVDNEIVVYLTAIITISVVLQYVIRKMPIRIYNNPDTEKYHFIFYSTFPFMTRRSMCKLNEVQKMPYKPRSLLPWNGSQYIVKHDAGIILLENFFRTPAELNIMLGIQKRYFDERD